MNLQDILINAGAGFTAGLAVGLAGISERREEKLRLVELIPEKKRIEIGGELTNKKLKDLKSRLKWSKHSLPFCVGGLYSLIGSLVSQNPHTFTEKLVVAAPCAYVGAFVGSRIRKFRNREGLKEQKNEIRAVSNPENIHRYFLPEDKQKIIDKAFSEIEKMVLNGKEEKILHDLHEGPVTRIYNAITEKKTKYTNMLILWSLAKQASVIENANFQKHITYFYEAPYQERLGPGEIIDCALLGVPQDIKLKVFVKEQNDFYVQTFNWPNLKIIANDKAKECRIENIKPETSISDREVWTGDYKSLAEFITKEREGYSVMLMKAPLELSSEVKERAITATFLQNYEVYHRNKRVDD